MKLKNYLLLILCVSVLQSNTQCTSPVHSNGQKLSEPPPIDLSSVTISMAENAPMSSNLYGFNAANFFFHYDHKDTGLQQLLDEVDAPLMRFPGGTTANFYHPAKEGYGYTLSDLDKNSDSQVHNIMRRNVKREQEYVQKGWIKENFIRQFSQLCKQRGAKVMYVANLYTGTDEEVVSAVQFLLDQGVDVVGIELGNEYYLKAYQKVFPSGDEYLNRAKQAASLLRAKFPAIPLAIVAAPCPTVKRSNATNTKKYDAWNAALGREDFYDGVVTHLYAVPRESLNEQSTEMVFDSALRSTSTFVHRDLEMALDYYEKWYGSDKKVWITEWNVQGVFQYFGNTFLQGTYFCEFAMEMLKHQQVEYAFCHNLLSGGSGFNLIAKAKKTERPLTDNSKYVPRMLQHVAGMLRPLFEANVRRLDVHGLPSNPYLQVHAFQKDKSLLVLIVNRRGDALNLADLQLPIEAGQKARKWSAIEADDMSSGRGLNPMQTVPTDNKIRLTQNTDVDLSAAKLHGYSINLLEFSLKKD